MAFTREFIRKAAKESGVELPKELEDALVQEHISARDAYSKEQVKAALEENKPDAAPAVKDTQEYKDLKAEFDAYKQAQKTKETLRAKEKAFRVLAKAELDPKATGLLKESRLNTVVNAAIANGVISRLELDENGTIKEADKLKDSIKSEWDDFIVTTTTQGADIANPPAGGDNKPKYVSPAAEMYQQHYNALHGAQKGQGNDK